MRKFLHCFNDGKNVFNFLSVILQYTMNFAVIRKLVTSETVISKPVLSKDIVNADGIKDRFNFNTKV